MCVFVTAHKCMFVYKGMNVQRECVVFDIDRSHVCVNVRVLLYCMVRFGFFVTCYEDDCERSMETHTHTHTHVRAVLTESTLTVHITLKSYSHSSTLAK